MPAQPGTLGAYWVGFDTILRRRRSDRNYQQYPRQPEPFFPDDVDEECCRKDSVTGCLIRHDHTTRAMSCIFPELTGRPELANHCSQEQSQADKSRFDSNLQITIVSC